MGTRRHVCAFNRECWCGGSAGPVRFHKAKWPIESDNAGVHPSQIPEAIEEAERLGTHISFTTDGKAIFQSQRHQDEYCAKVGLVNMGKTQRVRDARHRAPPTATPDKKPVYSLPRAG